MMRIAGLTSALLICVISASSADDVQVGDIPYSSGVLPDTQILIRNASGYDLSVWIATLDSVWRRYDVSSENSTLIDWKEAFVAIATTDSDDGETGNASPSMSPHDLVSEKLVNGTFYYRHLRGGTRALFCWSPTRDRWIVQVHGEQICN